jgi:hypothetical protein
MTIPSSPSEEVLLAIAWRAVRASYTADQLEGAKIELRNSVHSTFHVDDGSQSGGLLVEVWLIHPNTDHLRDADATADATGLMIQEIYALGYEDALMLLYHGYPDTPSRHRQAA